MGFILALFSYYFYFINELSVSASIFDSDIKKIGLVAQISMVGLYLLLVLERKCLVNIKQLYSVLPIFFILPFILYAWDPSIITELIPYIGFIFKLSILFNWIILGLIIGIIFIYNLNREKFQDLKFALYIALISVIIYGFGGIIFAIPLAIILFDNAPGIGVVHGVDDVIFPFNFLLPDIGEGTEGVIIVISIFFVIYLGARFVFPRIDILKTNTESKITYQSKNESIKYDWKKYSVLIVEITTAFASVSAAFSIMGFLVHDGSPQITGISIEFVLLSLLAPIPLILLVSRKMIFHSSSIIIKPS